MSAVPLERAGAIDTTPLERAVASGLWADAWRRLRRNRAAVVAGAFLVAMSALALAAPWLPGLADPTLQNLKLGATVPAAAHWFGTDDLGRDMLARVVYGGRISLLVGVVGTLVSLVIGVSYGAVAGYAGKARALAGPMRGGSRFIGSAGFQDFRTGCALRIFQLTMLRHDQCATQWNHH